MATARRTTRTARRTTRIGSSLKALLALLLAACAGCSTLPTIDPGPVASSRAPVRLEGARGPLSARQSKAVLARLESRGEETSIFDRHLALEGEIAGSPLVVGNKVTLLKDGPATYAAMFAAIAAARDHVHMETYIIEGDEVGEKFADAFIAVRAKGVSVSLIYDAVGSLGTPGSSFKRLTDAGVEVLAFNTVNPNHRDHRKILIVDGTTAFVGGVNISSVYSAGSARKPSGAGATSGQPWRDTHLRVEGAVVAEFQKLFLGSWEKQGGEALAARVAFPRQATSGREVVRAIASSPDDQYSLVYATLLSAIGSAETQLYLTNAYFVPDPQLMKALMDAARRGVDVKLVLPAKTDSWMVFHAGRASFDELLAAGVKIYARRDAMLHAKTAVVDGVWSTVGSSNLDWRSFLHNEEVVAVVVGQEFGDQMQAMFAADVDASDAITLQAWRARPMADRMSEMMAVLWSYWL
jgi:cardiolipin synthase